MSLVSPTPNTKPWYQQQAVWIMLLLGFSAGLPLLLIFSSLSLWLTEAGVAKSSVTFFSWAALGYSFKFSWAPLVDKLPIPLLSRLMGRRRSWLLTAQCMVITAILWMAFTDPQHGLTTMALAAVLLGFSSATQDVVIDALRIESANPELQALLSSTYITGYRLATISAGAGALFLAQYFGSTQEVYNYEAWRNAYCYMALLMLVGVATTLWIKEPLSQSTAEQYPYSNGDYLRFAAVFLASIAVLVLVILVTPSTPLWFDGYAQSVFKFGFTGSVFILAMGTAFAFARSCLRLKLVNPELVYQGYQAPIGEFFKRYSKLAVWVLLLIGFYRVSDIVMGVIANVFYQDMGYSKVQIASVTKVFGVTMTIAGGFLGGMLALRLGVMRLLMLGAVLVAVTNLLFMWLAQVDANVTKLAVVIAIDNLSQGIAIVAFIAWLSSITNISFTATQYAIFSSLMTLFPKLIAGYSGTLVEQMGYANFFLFASVLGVPVIILIYFLSNRLEIAEAKTSNAN